MNNTTNESKKACNSKYISGSPLPPLTSLVTWNKTKIILSANRNFQCYNIQTGCWLQNLNLIRVVRAVLGNEDVVRA